MRVVGSQDRPEIELDPVRALKRGRLLDSMLRKAFLPVPRGITRGTHEDFNRLDALRGRAAAQRLNRP
jgi:hypothetical protein